MAVKELAEFVDANEPQLISYVGKLEPELTGGSRGADEARGEGHPRMLPTLGEMRGCQRWITRVSGARG